MSLKECLHKTHLSQCDKCSVFLCNNDKAKHVNVCASLEGCDVDGTCSVHTCVCPGRCECVCECPALGHGFIRGSTLRGYVIAVSEAGTNIPKQHSSDFIYLNPVCMRLCNIYIGQPVIINNQRVLNVWPSKHVGGTEIGLSSVTNSRNSGTAISIGHMATVDKFPLPHSSLQSVAITCSLPSEDQEYFRNYFRQEYDHTYLCCGMSLKMKYYGQPLCLNIVETHRSDGVEVKSVEQDRQQISEQFDRLKLDQFNKPENKFGYVDSHTKLQIIDPIQKKVTEEKVVLGGLKKETELIHDLIEKPLAHPELYTSFGISPPKGILLFGPSGTGKTLLTQYIASTTTANVVQLSASQLWSKFYGETEAKLKAVFEEAYDMSPCLIIIDEFDVLCPRRGNSSSEVEKRVLATLLTLMDGTAYSRTKGAVIILATTNKPDSIDISLRRPGRLDREVEIGVPSSEQRTQILSALLGNVKHNLTPEEVGQAAQRAHGYVGADLHAAIREAGRIALKHCKECVNLCDIINAMQTILPSAMREVSVDVPKVFWTDIGGQNDLKLKLRQVIEWPLRHPEAFQRLGIDPPKGVLMYGPPGCSKTMIAKALATETGLNFLSIKGPELFSKWVGESERAVREVFRKARSAAPSIVFFDEIDALAGERGSSSASSNVGERVLAQLLTEMDGVEQLQGVTIVAATNRPDRIDKALMRPGRLDRLIYVPLPDFSTRREIFAIQFKKMPISDEISLEDLAKRTERYSGAEIIAVCYEAALSAMQEDVNASTVCLSHFSHALEAVKPRITDKSLDYYNNYQQ